MSDFIYSTSKASWLDASITAQQHTLDWSLFPLSVVEHLCYMTPALLYYHLCCCTVSSGISYNSGLIKIVKELPVVRIQYNKPMLKGRPAEGRVECVLS